MEDVDVAAINGPMVTKVYICPQCRRITMFYVDAYTNVTAIAHCPSHDSNMLLVIGTYTLTPTV